jgi:hypothetical protein
MMRQLVQTAGPNHRRFIGIAVNVEPDFVQTLRVEAADVQPAHAERAHVAQRHRWAAGCLGFMAFRSVADERDAIGTKVVSRGGFVIRRDLTDEQVSLEGLRG